MRGLKSDYDDNDEDSDNANDEEPGHPGVCGRLPLYASGACR